MSHQLVQCPNCDLVYADNPPDESVLAHAYHISEFDSQQEADDAAATYIRAVRPMLKNVPNKKSALEIGTGTGIFLEYLHSEGFDTVEGVEPSAAAIAAAPAHRRQWIREGIFKKADFEPASFDFICCFMTLEHVRDPKEIAAAASSLLRPGGIVAFVTHDYRSSINRLLGKRSPIIDIEHMQLFSRHSISQLLERNGFGNIQIGNFRNCYALHYWVRLLPINLRSKNILIGILNHIGLIDLKLSFNVGNIISFGYLVK